MYHGGQLSEDFYVGGKVDFFDYCDKDFMSLLEVDNMVEELGYGNASSTAGGGNSEVQTDGGVKKRKTRQPRK
ncbi:hypothetical protein DVH24_005236 [Malus domestica]|uniref:PB1-like domain-containing protein n=1 Tax=Malus domestica TaxID=3750 RepID=A0A498IGS7_MALDO|nr:hypothetical protein DVH24_005236 [Malus domestica]